jgi:putative transposase
MKEDSSIIRFRQSDEIDDPLTALLRSAAARTSHRSRGGSLSGLQEGVEASRRPGPPGPAWAGTHDPDRAGRAPAGQGSRPGSRPASERIRFSSALLPRWARRTTSLDALLPILYLRGVSAGDFQEALGVLLGKDACRPQSWRG